MKNYAVQKLYCVENNQVLYQVIELKGQTGETKAVIPMFEKVEGKEVISRAFNNFKEKNQGNYHVLGRIPVSLAFFNQILQYDKK